MGDDQAVELGQAALLGFKLEEVGEGGGADRDGRDAELFEEDRGVDTPRRAAASIAASDEEEVGPVAEGIDG